MSKEKAKRYINSSIEVLNSMNWPISTQRTEAIIYLDKAINKVGGSVMSKINVKESILSVVKKSNLEILKIDLMNDEESFVRSYGKERNEFCKVYNRLEDLDFEVESFVMSDEVLGTVYCLDKDTKEPVWLLSRGDECYSWWEVNRIPDFYKNKEDKK